MTVLVDEVIGGRGGGAAGRFAAVSAPRVRRSRRREQALRRPAGGARVLSRVRTGARMLSTVRTCARACLVECPVSRAGLLAAGFAMFAVIAFSGTVLAQMVDSMAPAVPDRTAVVSVGAGESLWDVARQNAPGSDPQAVVDRIAELNDLQGGAVPAGASLVVPAGR